MKTSEFDVISGGERVTCLLAEPERLAPDPALVLTFTLDRARSIHESPYNLPATVFVGAGHRALSFDLPHHGDRVGAWKTREIAGFCEAFLAGVDPFARVVADGIAAIDAVIARGLARPGRIALSGLSRGGYCALRLAMADARVAAVAALAPVTDWRALTEFSAVRGREDVASLALAKDAGKLAGKALFVSIGSADRRVGTECCAGLVTKILGAEAAMGLSGSRLRAEFLNDVENHRLPDSARAAGAAFLLEKLG